MRVFLDNCVHYKAKSLFTGHTVSHARDEGWQSLLNGALLFAAAKAFDAMVTVTKPGGRLTVAFFAATLSPAADLLAFLAGSAHTVVPVGSTVTTLPFGGILSMLIRSL